MTQTSQRRTAKITSGTSKARGYVAIHIDYLSPATNELHCTALLAMHIDGVNGAFVEVAAGQEFYLVRAGSLGPDMFYIVLINLSGMKRCSCAANKPCKHEIRIHDKEAQQRQAQASKELSDEEVREMQDTFDEDTWERYIEPTLSPRKMCIQDFNAYWRRPLWRDTKNETHSFTMFYDGKMQEVVFSDGAEDLARKFIEKDTDAHRREVLREYTHRIFKACHESDEARGALNGQREFSVLR